MKHDLNDGQRKDLEIAIQRNQALQRELDELRQRGLERNIQHSAIAQSEAFLVQSAEIAHLGYAIWDDIEDRDITVSEELASIHGLTKLEYSETVDSMEKYLEFVVPEDRQKYMNFENQFTADESGMAAGLEYRIALPDGEIRHLHQRSQYIPVSSGRPTQSIVVIQDITIIKQVEARLEKSLADLEESQALLTQSVAMANLGHAVWDYINEEYIDVSDEWARTFGYSKEEFLAKFRNVEQDSTLIHPDDVERYNEYYEDEDPDNLAPDIEYRIVTSTNETRYIFESYRNVFDDAGKPIKALVTIQDITDRIEHEIELDEAKQAAEQASNAKSSFLASISHEIRTPLNAVIGSLGLMESKELDPELQKYLSVGRKGAESLLVLINDILDFSKIEAGKWALEPALFSVRKTVADVLQVLTPRASDKNISLTAEANEDVPEFLIGDASRIRQVLLNLCGNAVRSTDIGGVQISVSKLKLQDGIADLRFTVEDTGCGVPQENQDRLFEEFWGTNSTSAGFVSGTGLGLPISKQLVQMMGGKIGFKSEPNRGSEFWFDLPLETPGEDTVKFEKDGLGAFNDIETVSGLTQLRGRVLLAEDNPANQLIGQAVLERIGLWVDVAANGQEVIAALENTPYDLVLMDINMPEMDGIEATSAIRKLLGAVSKIPIVAMTALAMPGDREKYVEAGMDGYISKPIIREELHSCLAKFLKRAERPPTSSSETVRSKETIGDSTILDDSFLRDLTMVVGADNLARVIGVYISDVTTQVAIISSASARGDCDLVTNEAHKLRSGSAYLGATGLAELASELEYAGREHDFKKIALGVLQLPSLFEKTREKLLRVHLIRDG